MSAIKEKYAPFFLFASAFLWSLCGIFTKTTAWNGVCLATLRGVISFVVVLILLRGRRIRVNRVRLLVAVCYFAQGVLFVSANKLTTAANATAIQNMSPLFIILFGALLYKKLPGRREILTCLLLFAGIALAFAGNFSGGALTGNLCALLSAVFYAGVFFFSKDAQADPLESLLLGNACYLFLLPYMLTNEAVRQTGAGEWCYLLILAGLSGIVAWLCFSVGIKKTSALQANFITMAEPVMSPLWTFIFLGERVRPLALIGCGLVIVTLIVYNTGQLRQTANE